MLKKIAVIDVETPNHKNDKICSLGITLVEDGIVGDTVNYLVNPECSFDDRNIRIHGITPRDVMCSHAFPRLWAEIYPTISGSILAAHNARFDLSVLKKTLHFYGVETAPIQFIDTYDMSCDAYPDFPNHRLDTICRELGIDLQHHDSGSDSRATAEIIVDMCSRGMDLESYVCTYNFSSLPAREPRHSRSPRLSDSSIALRELRDVLSAITSDDVINLQELAYLAAWIEDHPDLKGHYPFDAICASIQGIVEDGTVERSELKELFLLCDQLLDPVQYTKSTSCNHPIRGKNIVLSGEFAHGSKSEIEEFLIGQGAAIQKSVTQKTNIVLVGDFGNAAWVADNYGTKVKKALELQAKGIDVAVVKESVFYSEIEKRTNQIALDEVLPVSDVERLKHAIAAELQNEEAYSKHISVIENKDSYSIKAKSILVAKVTPKKKSYAIEFKAKHNKYFPGCDIRSLKDGMSRVTLSAMDEVISFSYPLSAMAVDVLTESGGENYGCCSRYEACSDAKKCIHPDKLFAIGCSYRRNMEQGKFFYGKNKNV